MELGREVLSRLSLEPVTKANEEFNSEAVADMRAEATYGDGHQED